MQQFVASEADGLDRACLKCLADKLDRTDTLMDQRHEPRLRIVLDRLRVVWLERQEGVSSIWTCFKGKRERFSEGRVCDVPAVDIVRRCPGSGAAVYLINAFQHIIAASHRP